MKVISSVSELALFLDKHRKKNTLGFVPTMGAIHLGHLSLLKKSLAQNDLSICSIFVNPTQFNNIDDLKNYPKQLDQDLALLKKAGCNIVFTPSDSDIYPKGFIAKSYDFNGLDKVLEGRYRPGHFEGVVQVVSQLFKIVQPHRAYFGEKDFQQLAIIRALVAQNFRSIDIISCPTIREKDGLAMSSRNILLNKKYRTAAARIYQRLKQVKKQCNTKTIAELKRWMTEAFRSDNDLSLEYFEIVDAIHLKESVVWTDFTTHIACVAVRANTIRLIDNILLEIN